MEQKELELNETLKVAFYTVNKKNVEFPQDFPDFLQVSSENRNRDKESAMPNLPHFSSPKDDLDEMLSHFDKEVGRIEKNFANLKGSLAALGQGLNKPTPDFLTAKKETSFLGDLDQIFADFDREVHKSLNNAVLDQPLDSPSLADDPSFTNSQSFDEALDSTVLEDSPSLADDPSFTNSQSFDEVLDSTVLDAPSLADDSSFTNSQSFDEALDSTVLKDSPSLADDSSFTNFQSFDKTLDMPVLEDSPSLADDSSFTNSQSFDEALDSNVLDAPSLTDDSSFSNSQSFDETLDSTVLEDSPSLADDSSFTNSQSFDEALDSNVLDAPSLTDDSSFSNSQSFDETLDSTVLEDSPSLADDPSFTNSQSFDETLDSTVLEDSPSLADDPSFTNSQSFDETLDSTVLEDSPSLADDPSFTNSQSFDETLDSTVLDAPSLADDSSFTNSQNFDETLDTPVLDSTSLVEDFSFNDIQNFDDFDDIEEKNLIPSLSNTSELQGEVLPSEKPSIPSTLNEINTPTNTTEEIDLLKMIAQVEEKKQQEELSLDEFIIGKDFIDDAVPSSDLSEKTTLKKANDFVIGEESENTTIQIEEIPISELEEEKEIVYRTYSSMHADEDHKKEDKSISIEKIELPQLVSRDHQTDIAIDPSLSTAEELLQEKNVIFTEEPFVENLEESKISLNLDMLENIPIVETAVEIESELPALVEEENVEEILLSSFAELSEDTILHNPLSQPVQSIEELPSAVSSLPEENDRFQAVESPIQTTGISLEMLDQLNNDLSTISSSITGLSAEELTTVMQEIDNLLEYLPNHKIEELAHKDFYFLYLRLLDDLGI